MNQRSSSYSLYGFGIMRDAQTAKPKAFKTRDGWFAHNLGRELGSENTFLHGLWGEEMNPSNARRRVLSAEDSA